MDSEKKEASKKNEYERFSVSVPADLNEKFEVLRGQLNLSRSDAIRKGMRLFLNQESIKYLDDPKVTKGNVLGTISYIEKAHTHYHDAAGHHHHDHDEKKTNLSDSDSYYFPVEQLEFIKANDLQHHFLDIIVSTTHIHAGPEKCMLIIAVNGSYSRVQELIGGLSHFKTIETIKFSPLEMY
ncbi:Putative nickel-responsive regulator [Candidatus Lokiarchaeum ossiferum]|uniref:Nickel-responsive regulator n=1 Tax=Candidatus Lokiarchaeum ossiferum TaxID=2951803 RepID=A0ABY6HUP2_9ARCH|nr:Putative nickel-responsive regulator [Candidatus Lokiarchaeum sp. B-35]